MVRTALALAATAVLAATAAADTPKPAEPDKPKAAALDDKNGFRDAKLGAELASFEGLTKSAAHGGTTEYTREADKLVLFETKLARIAYGFKDTVLDSVVITSAWSLEPKLGRCESDANHVAEQLIKAFGKPQTIHANSSAEGKRCNKHYGADLESPYCRGREWRGAKTRLSFFKVVTNQPVKAPAGAGSDKGEDWAGYACRYVLEYGRVDRPLDEL